MRFDHGRDGSTGLPQRHRGVNNHVGRRIVQRHAGKSGPVTRFIPGTPEYDQLRAKDNAQP